jgi:hypothetical protein
MIPKPKSLIEWMNTHYPTIKEKHRYSYACFECRKAFKERLPYEGVACCPVCGGEVWCMGLQFEVPRRENKAAWKRIYKRRTYARDRMTEGTRLLHRIEEDAGIRDRRDRRW